MWDDGIQGHLPLLGCNAGSGDCVKWGEMMVPGDVGLLLFIGFECSLWQIEQGFPLLALGHELPIDDNESSAEGGAHGTHVPTSCRDKSPGSKG